MIFQSSLRFEKFMAEEINKTNTLETYTSDCDKTILIKKEGLGIKAWFNRNEKWSGQVMIYAIEQQTNKGLKRNLKTISLNICIGKQERPKKGPGTTQSHDDISFLKPTFHDEYSFWTLPFLPHAVDSEANACISNSSVMIIARRMRSRFVWEGKR